MNCTERNGFSIGSRSDLAPNIAGKPGGQMSHIYASQFLNLRIVCGAEANTWDTKGAVCP